jgi:hypothetical protein
MFGSAPTPYVARCEDRCGKRPRIFIGRSYTRGRFERSNLVRTATEATEPATASKRCEAS